MNWITRDGTVIPIRCMTDSHLKNVVAFLRRRVDVYRLQILSKMSTYMKDAPDGAYDACSSTADWLMDAEPDEVLEYCIDAWKYLLQEAKHRGLEPKGEMVCN